MRIALIIPLFFLIGRVMAAEAVSGPKISGSSPANLVTFDTVAPNTAMPDISNAFPVKPDFGIHGGTLGAALQSRPTHFSVKFGATSITPETIEHHSKTATELLRSIMNGNSAAFVFWGTDRFKRFKTEKFQELASSWSSSLSGGWSLSYLGELKKGAAATTVWRVQFFDHSAEGLLTLATDKKGSVEAFGLY